MTWRRPTSSSRARRGGAAISTSSPGDLELAGRILLAAGETSEALRLRHFGEYALVEDNSERAEPASLVNLNAGWTFGALRVGASLLNVVDSRDADIQYFYGSRLPGEPVGGIEGRHIHPVEPRQIRVTLAWGL